MRGALLVAAAIVALGGCVPSAVGRPIDYEAARQLRVGEATPEDAIRVLGPPSMKSATGPDDIMYGWSYWTYATRTSESLFLRFRGGRLVELPGATAPATGADPAFAVTSP